MFVPDNVCVGVCVCTHTYYNVGSQVQQVPARGYILALLATDSQQNAVYVRTVNSY